LTHTGVSILFVSLAVAFPCIS